MKFATLRRMRIRTPVLAILFASFICPLTPARAASLTEADRQLWILCIKRVKMKPPCCGACKIITQEDAKALWSYVASDSPDARKKNEAIWKEHEAKLLAEFKHLDPGRYEELYGSHDLIAKQTKKEGRQP